VALACGVVRFNYLKFAIVSACSALVWTTAWIVGGYLVGGNKKLIEEWFSRASILVWLGFIALVVYYFRTRIKLILDLVLIFLNKSKDRVKNGFSGKKEL